VWSGLRPRSVKGRAMSVASVTLWRGKFTEGASDWRIWLVSRVPCCAISSAVKTSTGTASSSAAVCRAREPITTSMAARLTACAPSVKSWRVRSASRTVTEAVPGR
jgi:hypothetical protein